MKGLRKARDPVRAAAILFGLAAIVALPCQARAQEPMSTSKANLAMPDLRNGNSDHHFAAKTGKTRVDKRQRHAAKEPAKRAAGTSVPRATFEDRTAHYFDPLSLTLAPETRFDSTGSQYNQVTDSFTPADSTLVAAAPRQDPTMRDVTSASIENMGQGHNVTVVVPLFKILNSLSPGPAPQP